MVITSLLYRRLFTIVTGVLTPECFSLSNMKDKISLGDPLEIEEKVCVIPSGYLELCVLFKPCSFYYKDSQQKDYFIAELFWKFLQRY